MSDHVKLHYHRVHRALLVFLWAHIPILAGITRFFHTSIAEAVIIGTAICAGPTVAYFLARSGRVTSYLLAFAFACMSGLLIHLGRGMIEMHFHVFVMLGILIGLASPIALVINAATIAVHHVAFFFFLPESVFNYEATFGIVVVHAIFVIFETVPNCFIAFKFNQSIRAQAIVSERLLGTSDSLFQTVEQLNRSSDQLAAGSQEQLGSVTEISSAMEEISSMTETGRKRSAEARDISQSNQQAARDGTERMQALSSAMNELKGSHESISKIIATIDEIAFKTNILALNAAVEAARAGEAGQGFAVVAEEVRTLAQSSAEAARQTSQLINEALRNGETNFNIATQLAKDLSRINDDSERSFGLVAEIASGCDQQVQGVHQITQSVQRVDQITHNRETATQDIRNSSNTLLQQAEDIASTLSELDRLMKIPTAH